VKVRKVKVRKVKEKGESEKGKSKAGESEEGAMVFDDLLATTSLAAAGNIAKSLMSHIKHKCRNEQ